MDQPEPDPGQKEKQTSLSSLTRLAIGSLLAGYDGLLTRLSVWETRYDQKEIGAAEEPPAFAEIAHVDRDQGPGGEETNADLIRYAAIGWIFNAQNALAKSLTTADKMSRMVGGMVEKTAGPIYTSRMLSPFRNKIDQLTQHGQRQIDNWIEIGRKEEARSRALVDAVLTEQVDSSIEYLTNNEEVQELVQSQSVGLVEAIVEETRERTVSADSYLEAWARTMLRRPMRSELPPPAPEIRARAIPYRRIQGKVIKR
jgi:hypothetical protein